MTAIPEGWVCVARMVDRATWESRGFRDHLLAAIESEPQVVLDRVVEHPELDEVHVYMWMSPAEARRNSSLAPCPTCGTAPLILQGGEPGSRPTAVFLCATCHTSPGTRKP